MENEENPWISVEDRLPEPTTDLSNKNLELRSGDGDPWQGLYFQEANGKCAFTGGKWRCEGITHWRTFIPQRV